LAYRRRFAISHESRAKKRYKPILGFGIRIPEIKYSAESLNGNGKGQIFFH